MTRAKGWREPGRYSFNFDAEIEQMLEEFCEDEITAVESPKAIHNERRRNPKRSGDYLKADVEACEAHARARALSARVR